VGKDALAVQPPCGVKQAKNVALVVEELPILQLDRAAGVQLEGDVAVGALGKVEFDEDDAAFGQAGCGSGECFQAVTPNSYSGVSAH
jgi:hypothetical protein